MMMRERWRICEWHIIAIECNYTFVTVFVDESSMERVTK